MSLIWHVLKVGNSILHPHHTLINRYMLWGYKVLLEGEIHRIQHWSHLAPWIKSRLSACRRIQGTDMEEALYHLEFAEWHHSSEEWGRLGCELLGPVPCDILLPKKSGVQTETQAGC